MMGMFLLWILILLGGCLVAMCISVAISVMHLHHLSVENESLINLLCGVQSQRKFEPMQKRRFLALKKDSWSEGNLLSVEQLNAAEQVMEQYKTLINPVSPAIKHQLGHLKTRYNQYINLFNRLNAVHNALLMEQKDLINDELITRIYVEKPILLVKQYRQGDKWRVVPANSFIGDEASLIDWFQRCAMHPITKDNVLDPRAHFRNATRYVWHELTETHWYAQELGELTTEVNTVTVQLQDLFVAAKTNKVSLSSITAGFFSGLQSASNIEDKEENLHNKFVGICA